MKAENTIWVKYALWDFDWKEINKELEEKCLYYGLIDKAFVPQSAFDSIWLFYEYPDVETKKAILASLPMDMKVGSYDTVADLVKHEPDQKLLDYWTKK